MNLEKNIHIKINFFLFLILKTYIYKFTSFRIHAFFPIKLWACIEVLYKNDLSFKDIYIYIFWISFNMTISKLLNLEKSYKHNKSFTFVHSQNLRNSVYKFYNLFFFSWNWNLIMEICSRKHLQKWNLLLKTYDFYKLISLGQSQTYSILKTLFDISNK